MVTSDTTASEADSTEFSVELTDLSNTETNTNLLNEIASKGAVPTRVPWTMLQVLCVDFTAAQSCHCQHLWT